MNNKKRRLKKSVINTIYIINYILILVFNIRYLIYSIKYNNIIVFILSMILLLILLYSNNLINDYLKERRF